MMASRPQIDRTHWQDRLATLAARHRVPGAALGIIRRDTDEVLAVSTGVLNVATEVATTDDSVFQIGSITKVWTTTLVMQLVDEGLTDLDARSWTCCRSCGCPINSSPVG